MVVLRNPLDMIVSVVSMLTTFSHSKKIKEDFNHSMKDVYDACIKQLCTVWNNFNEYYRHPTFDSTGPPVFFLRYEDISKHP